MVTYKSKFVKAWLTRQETLLHISEAKYILNFFPSDY